MNINYEALFADLADAFYIVDEERRITCWNRAAEQITGYRAEDVIGSCCADNILVHVDESGRVLCDTHCPLTACLESAKPHKIDVFLHHKNGHRVPVKVRATPVHDPEGNIVGVAEFFSDNTEVRANNLRLKELERLAQLDHLTQLANRHYLEGKLAARIEEQTRYGLSFGAMFMDIDHFKRFNDRFGHEAGDLALKTVARTLESLSRPFDVFGRWGGEEFVGIIRNVDRDGLLSVAQRCRALIEKTSIPLKQPQNVTISIGATLARSGDDGPALLQRADTLMYRSKNAGRNRVTLD